MFLENVILYSALPLNWPLSLNLRECVEELQDLKYRRSQNNVHTHQETKSCINISVPNVFRNHKIEEDKVLLVSTITGGAQSGGQWAPHIH